MGSSALRICNCMKKAFSLSHFLHTAGRIVYQLSSACRKGEQFLTISLIDVFPAIGATENVVNGLAREMGAFGVLLEKDATVSENVKSERIRRLESWNGAVTYNAFDRVLVGARAAREFVEAGFV